jgi:hypothetical protein
MLKGFIEGHRTALSQLLEPFVVIHRQRLLQPIKPRLLPQPL